MKKTSGASGRFDWRIVAALLAALALASGSVRAQALWLTIEEDDGVFLGSSARVRATAFNVNGPVDFLVDGVLAANDVPYPFETTLTGLTDGVHRVQARTEHEGAPVLSAISPIEVIAPGPSRLLVSDFVTNLSTWAYADDLFRGTNQPKYAHDEEGGILVVGGLDDADIIGMSAGYVTTITLARATQVQLRFAYELNVAAAFETDEYVEVLAAVNGALKGLDGHEYVQRMNGPDSLRRQRVAVPLGYLPAGVHRVALGVHLRKKTEVAERVLLDLDWATIETLPAANALPAVTITSHVDGATYPAGGGPSMLEVTASDSDGSIAWVEVYRTHAFHSPIRVMAAPPYRTPLFETNTQAQYYVLAYDDRGGVGMASVRYVVGTPPNDIPHGSIDTPQPGQFVKLGGSVLVSGTARDSDGTVQRVAVYIEDRLKGVDYTAPYAVNASVAGLTEGVYGVRFVPFDNDGEGNPAAETYIRVTANLPPTAAFTSPAEDAVLSKGSTVTVKVSATDADGTVVAVKFMVDGRLEFSDTSAPFAWTVAGLEPGPHLFQAIAVDHQGKESEEPADLLVNLGVDVSAGWATQTPRPQVVWYYNPGEIVTVTALPPPAGKVFDQWIGRRDLLINPFAVTTTLKVPTAPSLVWVLATYKDAAPLAVAKLVLMDADRDAPIPAFDPLYSGAVLKLSSLPTRNLNVRAVTLPGMTGSVQFGWDAGASGGFENVENVAPYALADDDSGNYRAWTPGVGKHTLTAWAYAGQKKGGKRSLPLTINLQVVE